MQRNKRLRPPSSHPLHSAVVHFPFAFLSLSSALDVAYGLASFPRTAGFTSQVFDFAPHLGDIARFSYYSTFLGLAGGVAAVVTGGLDFAKLANRQDFVNKLRKSTDIVDTVKRFHPKLKYAFVHGLINDLVVFAAGYNWWTRRSAAMNAPSWTNVLVSAIGFVLLSVSRYLGAEMVYVYGVGVATVSDSRKLQSGKAE